MYPAGIFLKRYWDVEVENAAALAAIAVDNEGFREIIYAPEGVSNVSFMTFLGG